MIPEIDAKGIPSFGIGWPEGTPLIQRHNWCAYHNKGLGSFYHRKEIIKAIWPQFEWHRWNERRLRAVCERRWVTWMGPASSGKSSDAAVFALQRWLEAPDRTAVIVCSTSFKMLRARIWADVTKFHQALPKGLGPVGELIDSETRIRWRKGDNKNGIFGMAVEEGPVEQVKNNLIGIHTERIWLILDEMQGVREAIMDATSNMSKQPWFGLLGMGNPDNMQNPLLRESEPLGGWDSVERAETEEWETLGGVTPGNGLCQFFDGRKSPADDSPEERKRLYWLINKDQIANEVKGARGNMNSPKYWTMCIGWPPPMGIESTVLDESIIAKFQCRSKAVWTHGFEEGAALDPAWEGADSKILQFGKWGEVQDDEGARRWVIEPTDWIEVPIDAESSEPIHYQIMNFCKKTCQLRSIPPGNFAIDSTGEGGGQKAIFDQEWGVVIGVEFGGKPSERPLEDGSMKLCIDEYDTRATELNMAVRRFAMANGLRGLNPEAERQFKARKTEYRNRKVRAERKTEFKARVGFSPGHSDALCIFAELAIQKGAVPSSAGAAGDPDEDWNDQVRQTSSQFNEENYANAYD